MFNRFIPWKFLLKRVTKAHGFLDPIVLFNRFNSFSQPAKTVAPAELLRAGALMHARGLLNSQAIQHNLDWIWPYWVEQQFSPQSPSFIPRAFALTHINLTHRNWTAVGMPGMRQLPIVDPRGLVTPLIDGWSIDFWIIGGLNGNLIPSQSSVVTQKINPDVPLRTTTETAENGYRLRIEVEACIVDNIPLCIIRAHGISSHERSGLIIALRPYNPEGVTLLDSIQKCEDTPGWKVNKKYCCLFSAQPGTWWFSDYRRGDVYYKILADKHEQETAISCDIGLATAAVRFPLRAGEQKDLTVTVPLQQRSAPFSISQVSVKATQQSAWKDIIGNAVTFDVPDKRYRFLFQNAMHTMILHSPDDILAGPYTYHRFWFRDAVMIANAMLLSGLTGTCRNAINRFTRRQQSSGYYCSQEGEWDSNGQVLWICNRLETITRGAYLKDIRKQIISGANWICNTLTVDGGREKHSGLLPPGFSAEHLGPNDYYYWDDLWAIAGLRAAAEIMKRYGNHTKAYKYSDEAEKLLRAVNTSLSRVIKDSGGDVVMPASPYRRPDSASVASLVAGYPLQILGPFNRLLRNTVNYLFEQCTFNGALFHDVSHSGINPYLTLHIAQTLLRSHDHRFSTCVEAIYSLASSTGNWPEAIHPRTGSGCMGDGQHVWAAAEWVCMMRNMFVREEAFGNKLFLCTGLLPDWLVNGATLAFGPAPTNFGPVSLKIECRKKSADISWKGDWYAGAPVIAIEPLWGRLLTRSGNNARIIITKRKAE